MERQRPAEYTAIPSTLVTKVHHSRKQQTTQLSIYLNIGLTHIKYCAQCVSETVSGLKRVTCHGVTWLVISVTARRKYNSVYCRTGYDTEL